MTLIANALGTPPTDVIELIHAAGRKVAALCGSPYQAKKHAAAGVDIIIAQGGEGGGHCGDVGSIVLWPQVVKEVAAELGNTPAVCRKSYIHPRVLAAYLEGGLPGGRRGHEGRVLELLGC